MIFNIRKKLTEVSVCFNFIALGASFASAEGLTHDVWKMTGAYGEQVIQTINSNNMYPFVSSAGTEADEVTADYSDTVSDFDITVPSDIWFGEYHGERVHGYLVPKVTGIHKFLFQEIKMSSFISTMMKMRTAHRPMSALMAN